MSTSSVAPNPLRSLLSRCNRTLELVRILAPRELKVRYRQSFLDILWALIGPIVILIVYGLVLAQFGVGGTCAPYLTFAWTGLVLWTFFATAIGSAVTSLISASDMVTKVYFPREALPLATACSALVDLGIGLATLVAVLLVQGVRPGWAAVASIIPVLVVVVWTAALSVWAGVLAAFVRDVVHIVQLGVRVGFFATPVMYGSEFLPSQFAWTANVNPFAVGITGLRQCLLCNMWPDLPLQLVHIAAGAVALLGGILYTSSVESRIADVI